MSISLVVITDGRGQYLRECIASLEANITGDIGQRLVVSDAGAPAYNGWLYNTLPDTYELLPHDTRRGLAQAVRTGWEATNGDHVFHVEEDFTFNRPVNLDELQGTLGSHSSLAQMCLVRQPHTPAEKIAGGIVKLDPKAYTQGDGFFWHREIFSLNPCLIPRAVVDYGWESTEEAFRDRLLDDGWYFAYWGETTDPPWVTHIGKRRSTNWTA